MMDVKDRFKAAGRSLIWLTMGLAELYVLTYALPSFGGQYQRMGLGGLSHWEEYSFWVPAGFSIEPEAKQGVTRLGVMKAFSPLWMADVRWFHNSQDIYMTATRSGSGDWIYETNSLVRNGSGDWILTNFQPATASTK